MQNPECVVNRVYETKLGEFCVSFKFKMDELTVSDKEAYRAAWREGTPLSLDAKTYQDPNQTNL